MPSCSCCSSAEESKDKKRKVTSKKYGPKTRLLQPQPRRRQPRLDEQDERRKVHRPPTRAHHRGVLGQDTAQGQRWQKELERLFREQNQRVRELSLIHISEPTRLLSISYAVFC